MVELKSRVGARRAAKTLKRQGRRTKPKTPRKKPAPVSAASGGHLGIYHTSFGIVTTDEDPTTFQLRSVAGAKLLRPSVRTEVAVRAEAEAKLREAVEPGTYTDRGRVNAILRRHFGYFDGEIDRLTPRLASRGMVELVLHLYDESSRIDDAAKAGGLSGEDLSYWSESGHVYRRSLKYLAERSALAEPGEQPAASDDDVLPLTERALCVAEEAVQLAAMSDQTFGLFPDRSTLTIAPPGELEYVTLDVAPPDGNEFAGRIRRDLEVRARYLPLDYPLLDGGLRDRLLGPAFTSSFGASYADCVGLLGELVEGSAPPPTGFAIPFVLRQQFVDHLTGLAGMTGESANRLLDGFTVSPDKMRTEDRVLYKPKQEHRAYRRGLFGVT